MCSCRCKEKEVNTCTLIHSDCINAGGTVSVIFAPVTVAATVPASTLFFYPSLQINESQTLSSGTVFDTGGPYRESENPSASQVREFIASTAPE